MSSLNPVFILPGALRERAGRIAEGLCASMTLGVGQFCAKPGLVFGLDGAPFNQFQQALARSIQSVVRQPCSMPGSANPTIGACPRVSGMAGVEFLGAIQPAGGGGQDPWRSQGDARQPGYFSEIPGTRGRGVRSLCVADLPPAWAGSKRPPRPSKANSRPPSIGTPDDLRRAGPLLRILERKAGRLLVNGFATGVEVCPAMHHGGPFPSTTEHALHLRRHRRPRIGSFGPSATRISRPPCFPAPLKDSNPHRIWRTVNGKVVAP